MRLLVVDPIAGFQRDLHRLTVTVARMEEKIDRVLTVTDIVNTHTSQIATIETEVKGINQRFNELDHLNEGLERHFNEKITAINSRIRITKKEIYWTAGVVVATINFTFWFLERVGSR